MRALIDKRFKNRLQARFERFDVRAGILKDAPHRPAKSRFSKTGKMRTGGGLTTVEGMKARKMESMKSAAAKAVGAAGPVKLMTTGKLVKMLRLRTGINLFLKPFRGTQSREVKKFIKAFMVFLGSPKQSAELKRRAELALQEAIRAPIRKRVYGRHSKAWATVKGFQRRFFDTGQIYKAITAKISRNPKGGKTFGPFQQ